LLIFCRELLIFPEKNGWKTLSGVGAFIAEKTQMKWNATNVISFCSKWF
jgi:hypothetical protein